MLIEVFILIGFNVYFDFNKNMKTNRTNKWRRPYNHFLHVKVIVLNTGIFWLLRICSASFDHLIGEKTRMYFAKSLSDSIMNSYSLLPNITILIMQSTSMALQRI